MDRDVKLMICTHCGSEKKVLFYDSEACMTVDGCQETNLEKERNALAATCPRCHQQGFAYKQYRSLD
jgi:hypothetical protein